MCTPKHGFFTQSVQTGSNMSGPRSVKHLIRINVTQGRPSNQSNTCSTPVHTWNTSHPPTTPSTATSPRSENQDEVVAIVSPLCTRRTPQHLQGLLHHTLICCWYFFLFNYLLALSKLWHWTEFIQSINSMSWSSRTFSPGSIFFISHALVF